MIRLSPRERELLSWLVVALWTAVIFISVPLARTVQRFVYERFGRQIFRDVVLAVIVLAAGSALLYLYRRRDRFPPASFVWMTLVGAVFAWRTWHMREIPEEALHFIEYGVLGALIFRALAHRISDWTIYPAAIVIGTMVGTADEIWQWITPRRFWDYRDVWLNTFGVALVQVAIWKGIRPSGVTTAAGARSFRRLAGFAFVQVFLLGLCLMNTPGAVYRYTERFPSLVFLRATQNDMTEFGHRHVDPEIGIFYSRLTLEELQREDQDRAAEVGSILARYREMRLYPNFLAAHPAFEDPFLHEAGVHRFRRDHWWVTSPQHKNKPARYGKHMLVVFKEHQILEKYFGRSIAQARSALPARRVGKIREKMLREEDPYESPVSKHLITRFSQRECLALVSTALLVLGGLFVGLTHRMNK